MDRSLSLFIVLSLLGIVGSEGSKDTIGNFFESNEAKENNAGGVFLLEDIILPEAVVYRFKTYCVRIAPVWLQIWRPIDVENLRFQLVGQTRLVPEEVPRVYEVTLYTQAEMIFTQPGDRLGIWNELDASPLAYQLVVLNTNRVYRYSVSDPRDVFLGKVVQFTDLSYPYRFSVSVSYDTDVQLYQRPGTGTLIPPTVPPPPRTSIPPFPENEGSIIYAGKSLAPRLRQQTEASRGVYLLHDVKLRRGVVVKFFAFVARTDPVWFQIWRPVLPEGTYMLVGQVRYQPDRVPRAEQITVSETEYIFTQDNDVLGFMNEEMQGPIGYDWINDDSLPKPYAVSIEEGALPEVGSRVQFATFGLPYNFAIGVKYDIDPDPTIYGTPGTILPPTTTTPATTATPRTATPPLALGNNLVGGENIRFTSRVVAAGARKTFLMGSQQFPSRAMVTSFWAYAAQGGRIQFQVWRPANGDRTNFTLVGRKDFVVRDAPNFVQVILNREEQFIVEVGDTLGFANDGSNSTIGYHFETVDLYYSDVVFMTSPGMWLTFDTLPFPYNFALAATYEPVSEASSTAKTSEVDSTTAASLTSPRPVTSGPRTPSSIPATGESSAYGWLLDPDVLLAMFIWLIVITLLFLILCICIICRGRSRSEVIYRRRPQSFTNPVARNSSRPGSTNQWHKNMTSDESINYFNPTIGSPRPKPGDGAMGDGDNYYNNVDRAALEVPGRSPGVMSPPAAGERPLPPGVKPPPPGERSGEDGLERINTHM